MDTVQIETDTQLLTRFAETHEDDAFRAIVERHSGKVYACCIKILSDSHAADDATQAVFLLLAQKARGLKPGTVLAGWLYRTATLTALEARRALANRNRHEKEAAASKLQRASAGAGDEMLRTEVCELLAGLPAAQRDALVLHFIDGRTEADVAAELGCPPATIGARIARGLARLRDGLQRRGFTVAAPFVPVLIRQFANQVAPREVIESIRLTGPGATSATLRAVEFADQSTRAAGRAAVKSVTAMTLGAIALLGAAAVGIHFARRTPVAPPVTALPGPDIAKPRVLWDITLEGQTASHLIAGQFVVLSAKAGEKQWVEARRVSDGSQVWTSPTNGTLCYEAGDSIVCTQGADIFSIALSNGKERWRLHGDGARPHSPLVGDGGEVFTVAAQTDGRECAIRCLNAANGATVWEAPASIGVVACAPCVDKENVYAVGEAGIACVSRREQRVLWSQKIGAIAAPACVPGHVIIPGRELTCLSGKNGKWAWSVPGHLETSALTLSLSAAYTGLQRAVKDDAAAEGQAFTYAAVNPEDGQILWERVFPAEVRAGASVATHSVYVTCWDDGLYCMERETGVIRWRLPVALKRWCPTPLLADDRMLLCFQNKIMCIGQ